MDWLTLFDAIGLMLVMEGIFPFISPEAWRNHMRNLLDFNDKSLRIIGIISMLCGVVIIYLARFLFFV